MRRMSATALTGREQRIVDAFVASLVQEPASFDRTIHDEDEMYYVLEGKAQLKVGEKIHDIRAGSVLYVEATEKHSFFEIEEDMTLLVFFASGR